VRIVTVVNMAELRAKENKLKMEAVYFSGRLMSKYKSTRRYYPAFQHRQFKPRSAFLHDFAFLAVTSYSGMSASDAIALHDLGVSELTFVGPNT
jgi:hypothetical protein